MPLYKVMLRVHFLRLLYPLVQMILTSDVSARGRHLSLVNQTRF
jgi:hypothetical protein